MEHELQYRRLGRTDLMVAEVGIGTRSLATLEPEAAAEVVRAALDAGANIVEFDVAEERALALVATAIERRRPNVVLIASGDGGVDAARTALERLGAERFDCYLLDLDVSLGYPDASGAELLVELGLARFAGVSSSAHATALDSLLSGAADVVQAPFNLLEAAEFEALLRAAEVSDVGLLACSPLAGGRLGTHIDPARAEALAFLAHGEPRTVAQGAVAWALSEPRLSAVITGPRTAEQALELIEASRMAPLPPGDAERALALG